MMKKLLLICCLVLAANSVRAQGIPLDYGVRLALNMSKFSDDFPNWDAKQKFRVGFAAGMYATYMLQLKMALMAEVLYSQKGAKFESSSGNSSSDYTYQLGYMTLNVLFAYQFMKNLSFFIGPQLAFLLSATNQYESTYNGMTNKGDSDIKDELKAFEMGLVLGAMFQLTNGLMLDFRYSLGLTNVWDNSSGDYDLKNQMLIFGVAYPLSRLFAR